MSEKRDIWSKVEIVSSVVGGILLPIIVWWVGNALEQQQAESDAAQLALDRQQAEDELRTERAITLVEHMSSDNDRERLLAAKTAKSLYDKKLLPDELWEVFVEVAKSDPNPEVVAAITETLMARSDVDTAFADDVEDAFDELPIRVFIHYPTPAHKSLAESIATLLEKQGYEVRPLDLKPMSGSSVKVLAFRPEELDLAEATVDLLSADNHTATPEIRKGFENQTRFRQLEIWIGLGVSPL